ncbi:MAG: hypothetical protein ACP5UA_14065 [Candidatus Hydrogenedens sp.]
MKKYAVILSVCVAVLLMAQGCEQLSDLTKDLASAKPSTSWWLTLQLGYTPKNLVFTKKDVEKGAERVIRVWNRFPFATEMNFTVEPAEEWILADPQEGSSTGPWDREYISVKLDDSILDSISNTSPLESSIKIKISNNLEKEVKVWVIDNLQGIGNMIRERIRERIQEWLGNIIRRNNPGNNGGGNSGGNGNANGNGGGGSQ